MSNPKQDLGPGHPVYDALDQALARLVESEVRPDPAAERREGRSVSWPPRLPHGNSPNVRRVAGEDPRSRKQPDIFAEAVARAEQEQLERVEIPPVLLRRQSIGMVAKCAMAAAGAAIIALIYVVAFPAARTPVEDRALSASVAWQGLKSSLLSATPRKTAPTLNIHDGSGVINEPLKLGVSVDAAAPGMTVVIGRMPAGARLTTGKRASPDEWRMPALDSSEASIIPPADFVGEMDLSAELRGTDGVTLVTAFVRLTWASAPSDSVGTATAPAAPAPQQQPQALASPSPAATTASPSPAAAPPPASAEPAEELSPNKIAGMVRRAQELVASGDIPEARALLTRAAEAHNARAAFLLAKTFDPNGSKQVGAPEPRPDLAQARNWYQRAKEWGAPEAQRQLDALASYPLR